MKKYVVLLLIVLVIVLGLVFNHIDSGRVIHGERPKYTIKNYSEKENVVTYWGLGYKVKGVPGVSPKEKFESHRHIKMLGWFDKYEVPKDDKNIKTVEDFYNTNLTKGKEITSLTKNYSVNDAEKDGCMLKENVEIANQFNQKVKEKKSVYQRVCLSTIEGDLIIKDLLYNEVTNQLVILSDETRDKFIENPKINIETYEKSDIYNPRGKESYWVFYTGKDYVSATKKTVISKVVS